MVAIIDSDITESIELDEYVDYVETYVDVFDYDSLVHSAGYLRRLANNRHFLLQKYHDVLKVYWEDPSQGRALPQSIVPVRRDKFYIRANIWLPIETTGEQKSHERNLYSYDVAHDHNYDFATVGYFGPGYTTELYDYDYETVDGYIGEKLILRPLGTHQLNPGRVMIYRSGRDVHIQNPPDDVSISLNLMCKGDDRMARQQYLFDTTHQTIVHGAGDVVSMRLYLIGLMRHIHNGDTAEILSSFARDHNCPRTRAFALRTLEAVEPGEAERLQSLVPVEVLRLSKLPLVNGTDISDRRA